MRYDYRDPQDILIQQHRAEIEQLQKLLAEKDAIIADLHSRLSRKPHSTGKHT